MRVNAVQHIFTKSAPRMVEEILAATDVNAPPASIPKPINMAKIANRVRRKLKPQDPQDLDFVV